MNIQDNCLNIPEKPTERNFGLLLSKKYRAKMLLCLYFDHPRSKFITNILD